MKRKHALWPPLWCGVIGLSFALLASMPAWAAADWFKQGETLRFGVYVWGLRAGEAELRYEPAVADKGHKVPGSTAPWRITGRAWTGGGLVGGLMTLRDRLQAWGQHTPAQPFEVTWFDQQMHENDYRADKTVVYRQTAHEATYTNNRAPKSPPVTFPLKTVTRDALSALYYLRQTVQNPQPGKIYEVPVLQLDRPYLLQLEYVGDEQAETPWGEQLVRHFRRLNVPGGGKHKTQLDLWVERSIELRPVRIEYTFKYGTFRAELEHVGAATEGSTAPAGLPLTGPLVAQPKQKDLPDDFVNPVDF